MMGHSWRHIQQAATLASLGALVLTACQKDTSDSGVRIGASDPKQTELPGVEVKLPLAPSFTKEHSPEAYSDGSLSLFGVRKSIESKLGQEVIIRAHVVDVYQCPPCPKGMACKPCSEPHFWIADRPNVERDKALMVVDLPEKKPKVEVGKRYLFSGTFSKSSASGFKASDGLLVYAKHATENEGQ